MLSVLNYRAVLPLWFVSVGLIGMLWPPPTVAISILLFAITVVVIPTLIVTMRAEPRTLAMEKARRANVGAFRP
jgi:hypothetical protein